MELIKISKKFGKKTIIIDDEDFEKIKNYTISLFKDHKNGSIYCRLSLPDKSRPLLHRFLMDCPKEFLVDHINHNTLDNRKENFRLCTHAENVRNRIVKNRKNSKYKGVYISGKSIYAKITFNKKIYKLGKFKSQEAAALAYNKKAKELHKEFAYLNKIS